jgi:hypothetical protein
MMISSFNGGNVMYNPQVYDGSMDKVYVANAFQASAQQTPSNASTWAGNDVESVASGDSYWDNTGHMASPQMHAQQMHAQQQMYMMPNEAVPPRKHDQGQFVPVSMVPTPFGYMPVGPGSPMGSPMGSQGTPLAMPPMSNAPAGMTMMQAVPAMQSGDPSTPTSMQMQPLAVSPASPQGMMMQSIPSANGDGMQMMPAGVTAVVIPAGMPFPGLPGMQAIQMAPPPGYMYQPANKDASPTSDQGQSPTGEKKKRLLEDLLPGGVRRRATREDLGRKVFVGGLNPTTTTEDLRAYFSDFGTVTDSCVITDSSSKASRGFGFVEFEGKIPEGLLDQQHIIDQRRCGVREYGHSTASP